ncbi:hypothetical protein [Methylocaldum szegediense]|uniref:hypothetical protein n=1 Tax=Methylocaldum szegediense TaxID=73780 RepID=UPI0012EB184D|nr:hypothetical protein [Methylocaldum szegediense]
MINRHDFGMETLAIPLRAQMLQVKSFSTHGVVANLRSNLRPAGDGLTESAKDEADSSDPLAVTIPVFSHPLDS